MKKIAAIFMITALGLVGCNDSTQIKETISYLTGSDAAKAAQAQKDLQNKGAKVIPDLLKIISNPESNPNAVKLAAEILTQFANEKRDMGENALGEIRTRMMLEGSKATRDEAMMTALKNAEAAILMQKGCLVPVAPTPSPTPPPAQ